VNVGAGRKKGVWNSRCRIGESSDVSLPNLSPGMLLLDDARAGCGYGDPQLAV
jgi:hypothetical protein